MKYTKQQLVDRIVKGGANEVSAKEDVNNNYDYIARAYKDSTLSEWADVATTLG